MLQSTVQRRAVRRAVGSKCQAVQAREFRLFGEQVRDLSPRGMLVRCDDRVCVGDDVLLSFKAPGCDELWLDAEAVVTRLVQGLRFGDRGVCAGLEFTYFDRKDRHELLTRLAGLPPPVPQRPLRTTRSRSIAARGPHYALARAVADGPRHAFVRALPEPVAAIERASVVVERIVSVWDEPEAAATHPRLASGGTAAPRAGGGDPGLPRVRRRSALPRGIA